MFVPLNAVKAVWFQGRVWSHCLDSIDLTYITGLLVLRSFILRLRTSCCEISEHEYGDAGSVTWEVKAPYLKGSPTVGMSESIMANPKNTPKTKGRLQRAVVTHHTHQKNPPLWIFIGGIKKSPSHSSSWIMESPDEVF